MFPFLYGGALGPIDAQVRIGLSIVSSHDYLEWVKEKRQEAKDNGTLNLFDATVIAQISPGELNGVFKAQKFAENLVKEWLPKYKIIAAEHEKIFKNATPTIAGIPQRGHGILRRIRRFGKLGQRCDLNGLKLAV